MERLDGHEWIKTQLEMASRALDIKNIKKYRDFGKKRKKKKNKKVTFRAPLRELKIYILGHPQTPVGLLSPRQSRGAYTRF